MTLNRPSSLIWVKSSYSSGSQGCVEVADLADGGKAVRDSKLGEASPVLVFTAQEWTAFTTGILKGELR